MKIYESKKNEKNINNNLRIKNNIKCYFIEINNYFYTNYMTY